MKRNLLSVLFTPALALSLQPVFAGTADNFNSRPGIGLSEVKGYLQGNCWFFADFDVNRSGWSPNMEGDGAMVSGTGASATEKTGIFTPLLDMPSSVAVSFIYSFNLPVQDRRWVKVYAADGNDNIVALLDSVELTGSQKDQVYHYSKSLQLTSAGSYKLYINYQGIGGNERIAIDQLSIGATAHYNSTCNAAPVTLRDKFTGTASHTANGNVLSNDYDPNHETMTAYLLSESPDGRVELQKDGQFTFTPREGFSGSQTQFAYKVCDNGSPALCSMTTTATIKFPSRSTLTSFQALYSKKEVAVSWNAATDNHSKLFQVERSLDGEYFKKVGEVNANDGAQEYAFSDKIHEQERKNDLYYRIRQVDAAGRITYSKVLILRSFGSKSVEAVSVTPDPNVNDIQVNVQLKEKSFVMVKVMDAQGSELIKQSGMGDNGSNTYNIEGTSNLQPGMYQLEVIINSNEKLTMKLAKS